jgi:hypothetical protein
MEIAALDAERTKLLRQIKYAKIGYWLFLFAAILALVVIHRKGPQIDVFAARYYVYLGFPIMAICGWIAVLKIRLVKVQANLNKQKT